jgi:hypothetical protein
MQKVKKVGISEIQKNPDNPRIIKDANFKKLVQSIKDFPEMLDLRPIVVNKQGVILGGNMRFEACKSAGLKQVPVIYADTLTPEQEREFIIKDNVSGGEWDWAALAEWDTSQLADWGLEVPEWPEAKDFSDKNEEVDTSEFSDKMTLVFELTSDEYQFVAEYLAHIDANKEQAILKILGYESES